MIGWLAASASIVAWALLALLLGVFGYLLVRLVVAVVRIASAR